jgi:uncharacterized small protein (DUF1192 family)
LTAFIIGLDILPIPRFNHEQQAWFSWARHAHAVKQAYMNHIREGWGEGSGPVGEQRGKTAMTFDEEPIRTVKRSLDDMSIQELKERIETLRGDIAACEQMIVKKEATRKAAEAAFFKS